MKREILILILLTSVIYASQYYADLNIKVDSRGYTTITGNTNYPNLITANNPQYTSKKGIYWTLNISKPEQFSEFIYTIKLPETASINYIKSTGVISIQNQGNNLIIKGYGENKPLSIITQYKINKKTKEETFIYLSIIASIIALITTYYFYRNKKSKRHKKLKKKQKARKVKKKKIKIPPLPERQKKIIQLLIEKNKPMTQAQIRKELNLPKASTTRNINSLELKGLITKEKIGITNLIKIKK